MAHSFRHALKWSYVMNLGQHGVSVLISFILAAILGPVNIGTLGIASLYILLVHLILEQGLSAAVIQRKDLRPDHLDGAFWLVLAMSCLLAGLTLVFSAPFAAFMRMPDLAPVVRMLSISIPVQGLTVVQQAVLQRQLDFKSLALRANGGVLVGGVTGVALAFQGFGVWALVAQRLVTVVVSLVLLWSLSPWRPRLRFPWRAARELLGFSTGSFFAKLGVFANRHTEELFLGYFFGVAAAGRVSPPPPRIHTHHQLATRSIAMVSFPSFSRDQDDREKLRTGLLRCLRLSAVIAAPAMAAVVVVSGPLTRVLGERWAGVENILRVLAIAGLAQSLTIFTGPLLQAVGKPHSLALFVWISALLSNGAFLIVGWHLAGEGDLPLAQRTLAIAAARASLYALIYGPVSLVVILRVGGINLREVGSALATPLLAGRAGGGGGGGVQAGGWGPARAPVGELILAGGLSCIGSALTLLLLDEGVRGETRRLLSGYRGGVDPRGGEAC
ncbi:MAG: oligosaccharide flippase family protein [Planctomycetota bacterium]